MTYAEVTVPTWDLAELVAGLVTATGDVYVTITPDSVFVGQWAVLFRAGHLDRLAELPVTEHGNYHDNQLWIGGQGYRVIGGGVAS